MDTFDSQVVKQCWWRYGEGSVYWLRLVPEGVGDEVLKVKSVAELLFIDANKREG